MRTQRFHLIPRDIRRRLSNHEVKLNFGTVDMTVIIHYDSLDTTSVHVAHELTNPNR